MGFTRRSFLELAGGSLAYAFCFSCSGGNEDLSRLDLEKLVEGVDLHHEGYTEWLFIHGDGSATAHTGRIELGQGLKTVLSNVICQVLDLPPENLEIVMGDTDTCPDDGPTEGSNATRTVGWGYWLACQRVREDLIRRAAIALDRPADQLRYRKGKVVDKKRPKHRIGIGALADGSVQVATIDPKSVRRGMSDYVDRGTPAVNAEAIVTGTLTYAGDLFPGECDYGALLPPRYHKQLTRFEGADLEAASRLDGVHLAARTGRSAFAVANDYPTVHRALDAMEAVWSKPRRPRKVDLEKEIRAGAKLRKIVEDRGDPRAVMAKGRGLMSETYTTQYASQVPIETETAVARFDDDGEGVTVWASTQAPFKALTKVAKAVDLPEDRVRIIGMPVGGGFGVKVDTPAPAEAAVMARDSGRTIKHVYSREFQFIGRTRFKEAVVIDIASSVGGDGRLVARTIDIYQDEGFGTTNTYDIPHVATRLFHTPMPVRHGTMRGTSFVQSGFAMESHTDMLAEAVGLDPVEFRKRNLAEPAFVHLLDACAEMIDYRPGKTSDGSGTGFAICTHGGRQLGAVAAELSVDRKTGLITVHRLCGAFDIGTVINRNTLTANTKGAMIWGLGFALFEEALADGHTSPTRSLDDYRIPRFQDVPPIELAFLDNASKTERPRGCGELPVIPTVGAICNAVYRATGFRFHTLPLTPERVLAALNR